MITSLTKPISIKRDGDNYQYITKGKLDFVFPVFPNSDYANSTFFPIKFALLPSGMIYLTGQFFVVSASAGPVIFSIPAGFRSPTPVIFPIVKSVAGNVTFSTLFFNDDVASIGSGDPATFPPGEYYIGAIQYIPAPA